MRGAVICVGVMLAIVQLWPTLFGGGASAAPASATTMAVPPAREALSCRAHYRRVAAACTAGGACRLRAADDRDLCEANGRWPG